MNYTVKKRVLETKKVATVNISHYNLEIVAANVDFFEAKKIMKENKGSSIFPYKKSDLGG
jgi:hypothetical protein